MITYILRHFDLLDPMAVLVIVGLDAILVGAVLLRIYERIREAKWNDLADQRRELWYAAHPEDRQARR